MKTEDWNYETEKVIEFQTIVRMYGFLRHRSPDERGYEKPSRTVGSVAVPNTFDGKERALRYALNEGWTYDDIVDWGTARLSYARQHCTVNLCETKPESGGE